MTASTVHDPHLAPSGAFIGGRRPAPLGRVGAPLLERDHELAQLTSWLREAVAGHGRLVLVGGEAGVGKSTLVDRFATDVPERLRLLVGALDAWRSLGDRRREGDALHRLSRLQWMSHRGADSHRTASAAVSLLERIPPGAGEELLRDGVRRARAIGADARVARVVVRPGGSSARHAAGAGRPGQRKR